MYFSVVASAQFRQILPLVRTGEPIVIVNDEPNDQTIYVKTLTQVLEFRVKTESVLRLLSPESGYALVESDKTKIRTYAVINGTTIPGMALNTYTRSIAATDRTGIAIANPWDKTVTVTFEIHSADAITRRVFNMKPGSQLLGFLSDLQIHLADSNSLIFILSSMPVGVGAADCQVTCMTIPVGSMGVKEIGPVN